MLRHRLTTRKYQHLRTRMIKNQATSPVMATMVVVAVMAVSSAVSSESSKACLVSIKIDGTCFRLTYLYYGFLFTLSPVLVGFDYQRHRPILTHLGFHVQKFILVCSISGL